MKRALAAILAIAAFSAFAEDAETATMVNASLKDGSTVKGEFCSETITGSTLFMEKLDLTPAMVKSLVFSDPSLNPECSTKSPFLIDEFKIWNYSKTDFDL